MDGANRLPKNGHSTPPAPNLNGAVHLGVVALQTRVSEIYEARMKQPMPEAPILSETMTIIHRGSAEKVSVDVVRGEMERAHHEVSKELMLRGIDPGTGEFLVRPLDAGLLRSPNGDERPQVRHQYIWAPHDKVDECRPKPTLVT